jgi:hypothetical protein
VVKFYDAFIDRLSGLSKVVLALGKAMFLASRHEVDRAARLIEEISQRFSDDPLVMFHVDGVRKYCDSVKASGIARPVDSLVGW